MTSTRVEDFKLEDWLPYWVNPNDLIALLAHVADTGPHRERIGRAAGDASQRVH